MTDETNPNDNDDRDRDRDAEMREVLTELAADTMRKGGVYAFDVPSRAAIEYLTARAEAALNTLAESDDEDKWRLHVEFTRRYKRQAPTVPETPTNDAGQKLVFLEQFRDIPGQFHRIPDDADESSGDEPSQYTPDAQDVLTTEARARDLSSTPCPTCYPESLDAGGENEDMEVSYLPDGTRRIAPKTTDRD
jgi:hypothetical protein